ncbi:hypothetical protein PQX77_013964 [Marasmius sp. AFHP31]|nr:hypothetical protein PQX77_013964 [Marasmius sp. AFHP31]
MKSTLFPSVSIPEQSVIPFSPVPCYSPYSIEDSAFIAVENASDLAPPASNKHKKTGQGCVNPHGSYPLYKSQVDHVDYAQLVSPNCHIGNSVFSSLPITLTPRQQWCYDNQSSGTAESGTTNIGSIWLLDSESSTAVEEPTIEWWDRDWDLDSLFSSNDNKEDYVGETSQYFDSKSGTPYGDTPYFENAPEEPEDPEINDPPVGHPYDPSYDLDGDSDYGLDQDDNKEDCIEETSQYSDLYSGTPHEDTPHLEHEPGELVEPEFYDLQLGDPCGLPYDSDGASQQSDNVEIDLDSLPDLEYPEEGDHHHVNLDETVYDHNLEGGTIWPLDEDEDSPWTEFPEFTDNNEYCNNLGALHGDGETYHSECQYKHDEPQVRYDDETSQRWDGSQMPLDDSTHLEVDEQGDDFLSGEEYTECDDGASQCSDEWGIPPDEQSDRDYESSCENEECYKDDVDQYEHEDVGDQDAYLVLVSQHFPHSLWSLQLPKPTLLLQPLKQNSFQSFDLSSLQTILANNLSSHIPFFVTFVPSNNSFV